VEAGHFNTYVQVWLIATSW